MVSGKKPLHVILLYNLFLCLYKWTLWNVQVNLFQPYSLPILEPNLLILPWNWTSCIVKIIAQHISLVLCHVMCISCSADRIFARVSFLLHSPGVKVKLPSSWSTVPGGIYVAPLLLFKMLCNMTTALTIVVTEGGRIAISVWKMRKRVAMRPKTFSTTLLARQIR